MNSSRQLLWCVVLLAAATPAASQPYARAVFQVRAVSRRRFLALCPPARLAKSHHPFNVAAQCDSRTRVSQFTAAGGSPMLCDWSWGLRGLLGVKGCVGHTVCYVSSRRCTVTVAPPKAGS